MFKENQYELRSKRFIQFLDSRQEHAGMTVLIYALRQTEGFDVGDQKICLFCKLFYQFIHANFLEHQHRLELITMIHYPPPHCHPRPPALNTFLNK